MCIRDSFQIAPLRYLAAQHQGHRAFLMGHELAIGKIQSRRAAKPFAGILQFRFPTPQFRRAAVELPHVSGGVAGIDPDRPQIKQGAETFFARDQRIFGLLAFGDVTDVAMNDLIAAFVVEIADEFNLPALAPF